MKVLIGGYTKKTSKGIYELPFTGENSDSRLGKAENIVSVGGPTYFQKDGDLIFAINNAGDKGGISVFKVNEGGSNEVDRYLTSGSSPAYVGINRDKKLLYTANYHTAVLSVFHYNDSGKLDLITTTTHKPESLGPRPEQADGPHPHFFDETPAGNLVCCDLDLAQYKNEAGFGDRHIVFSKDGNYFYVVGELSSKINVVKFNEDTWDFEDIATYKTIPNDFTDHNGAAAVYISNDGKYIYVSNRGHNSIVVFKVSDNHTLSLVQRVSTFGDFPRDFNWDESEKYLVAANQNSDNATLYLRNGGTGTLTPIQKDIEVPEGTRVLFTK